MQCLNSLPLRLMGGHDPPCSSISCCAFVWFHRHGQCLVQPGSGTAQMARDGRRRRNIPCIFRSPRVSVKSTLAVSASGSQCVCVAEGSPPCTDTAALTLVASRSAGGGAPSQQSVCVAKEGGAGPHPPNVPVH